MKRRDLMIAILALVLIWQATAMVLQLAVLPTPLMVARVFFQESANLAVHFGFSLWRVMAGITVSILLAVPAGLALGQSQRLSQVFSPVIYLIYPIPKVVFVPIVLILLGIGELAKITLIVFILFFQILVLVRDQAATIPLQLVLSLRSLGAGRRALFRFIYFPASLPAILTAIRQSIGTAVAILYITELFATRYGLGYYIYYNGSSLMNYPAMYAGIVAMSILGLGLYFTVDLLEHGLCKWLAVP